MKEKRKRLLFLFVFCLPYFQSMTRGTLGSSFKTLFDINDTAEKRGSTSVDGAILQIIK